MKSILKKFPETRFARNLFQNTHVKYFTNYNGGNLNGRY